MDIAHFTLVNSKPGNFDSLREVVWIIFWHCYLEIDWRWESVSEKSVMVINILQMICIGHVPEAPGLPADMVVESSVKNCTARFYNHSTIKLSSKEQLKIQSTEKSFCICLWSNNQVLSINFITCLYFPLVSIRWSHYHLMDLFKSKGSSKEKFDSNNNWNTAWTRMILEGHLFLRLSSGFIWKMLIFVGKHLSFYPKNVCSFTVFST